MIKMPIALIVSLLWTIPLTVFLVMKFGDIEPLGFSIGALGYLITYALLK